MNLHTLWKFSRPHTIIGSTVSIVVLFLLQGGSLTDHYLILLTTLVSALGCNVCITGLNQVIDVELDKINKPELPIASGELSIATAKKIVVVSGIIAIGAAALLHWVLFLLIAVILLLGIAYSVPPIQLKQHHLPAALAITIVRGVLVNIGMALHFSVVLNGNYTIQPVIYPLTIFISAFSLAIAWYKDLPDRAGDAHFGYRTFPLLYSPKTALYLGAAFVMAAYGWCIYWSYKVSETLLMYSLIALSVAFFLHLQSVRLDEQKSIRRFYQLFWVFFFATYLSFLLILRS
ncbi:MAG: homogentisate phytyltransferase [Chitinophagaceae bacterium]|jgi:homogentisate phytyltransferase/homogentisate geranylgeranyltransferase